MDVLNASWLGRVRYAPTLALQRALAEQRAANDIADTVLLLEHEHVYTLGRRATDGEILLTTAMLGEAGIDLARTDRGGLATYHGPGQLVGYPIISLGESPDVPSYVAVLERALVDTVAEYGIVAGTVDEHRGVWVGDQKIAAIGVHVSRGITTHGFALNVSCDLSMFGGIIPCGIPDKGVASIASLTGASPDVRAVGERAVAHIAAGLGARVEWTEAAHV